MEITDEHLLSPVVQKPVGGLYVGSTMSVRRCLVIHYTEGVTAQSSIDWWNKPQNRSIDLGAHIIIDRDGTIMQCRAFNRTISHAGASRWKDPNTGTLYTSANGYAIGIELANAGNAAGVIQKARLLPQFAGTVQAKHRNGGSEVAWEKFPEAQINVCIAVSRLLVQRYNLDDITGHDCIAPERKKDPGPACPLQAIRQACGFQDLPVVHWP